MVARRGDEFPTEIPACTGAAPLVTRLPAALAGQIRAHLASKGTPIGPYDVMIAGQARARELTLVTHNTSEFRRVPGLKVEDWKASAAQRRRRIKP